MKIKTLAEILAESDTDSASTLSTQKKGPSQPSRSSKHSYKDQPKKSTKARKRSIHSDEKPSLSSDSIIDVEYFESSSSINQKPAKSKKRKKRFHPAANFTAEPSDASAYQPPEAQSIKEMLAEVKHNVHGNGADNCFTTDGKLYAENSEQPPALTASVDSETHSQNDNLPAALKAYLRTPEQRQAEVDAIKAESRLRWLAFYYLSRREYGKAELKQKLIDKEQDPERIDALLDEFEEKGYQSDYRTTLMLIRENIRKGRGRGRIKQEFYRKKIAMPSNIDELIDMANNESDEFSEFVDDSSDNLIDGVDWLKLAVIARTKKYGDDIPIEQKDKARQLRFLQYRGFNTDICFAALNYTLETLDERF
ncbi:regulatory protein RecX [Psychrobacter aquaticus]|uniref:Regulatory protein RecX n=1 Tax=Psychrobacter aquaticus CMS 56 TaxID=1354303 RepID=U4TDJ2_9GAMM|nr:regulatory protein RecX [Psychrobacter aquaticus]ERL56804.1 Regulatory protein RecX [Psychrobacter aquaticus CMS 56]